MIGHQKSSKVMTMANKFSRNLVYSCHKQTGTSKKITLGQEILNFYLLVEIYAMKGRSVDYFSASRSTLFSVPIIQLFIIRHYLARQNSPFRIQKMTKQYSSITAYRLNIFKKFANLLMIVVHFSFIR